MTWGLEAACAGHEHPEWWFPTRLDGPEGPGRAIAICRECPVRTECLAYAQHLTGEIGELLFGVWGGQLFGEGKRPKRKPKPFMHGTASGYIMHRRRGEQACALCKAAHARAEAGRASIKRHKET